MYFYTMKSILILLLFIPLFFIRCTLSADQEKRVMSGLNLYKKSIENKDILQLVALEHPSVVKYYKNLGDSLFLDHYLQRRNAAFVFDNPFLQETKQQGKTIQLKFKTYLYQNEEEISDNHCIFAISEDEGNNWSYVSDSNYFSSYFPKKLQFFKK